MAPRRLSLEKLPLFASEEEVSTALMGPGNYVRWRQVAPLLEGRGFPKIDALMGGRYTPAIKAYFDRLYGIVDPASFTIPDGQENWDAWKPGQRRGRQA